MSSQGQRGEGNQQGRPNQNPNAQENPFRKFAEAMYCSGCPLTNHTSQRMNCSIENIAWCCAYGIIGNSPSYDERNNDRQSSPKWQEEPMRIIRSMPKDQLSFENVEKVVLVTKGKAQEIQAQEVFFSPSNREETVAFMIVVHSTNDAIYSSSYKVNFAEGDYIKMYQKPQESR